MLLGAIALLAFLNSQKSPNVITLTSVQNKFKVEFAIAENQMADAAHILEKLGLAQNFLRGFEFELDSTSSAKLAFASPITTQVKFTGNTVLAKGKTKKSLASDHQVNTGLKIPKDTQIGVFTKDFNKIVYQYLETEKLRQWFAKNAASYGQHLIIFGRENFAIIIPKSDSLDLNSLVEAIPSEGERYKQEIFEVGGTSIGLHSIKLAPGRQHQLLTIFELGDFLYLTTSPAAARDLINSQLGNAPSVNFATKPKTASFFAFFTRVEGAEIPQVDVVFPSQLAKYLESVKKANLEVTGEDFSGYLELVE